MEVPLVLEAMDCALIEILQVYGEICTGVARFLVGVPAPTTRPRQTKSTAVAGIKVLRKAAEKSAQLSSYFELCRSLGVVNVRELEVRRQRRRRRSGWCSTMTRAAARRRGAVDSKTRSFWRRRSRRGARWLVVRVRPVLYCCE
jgi:hypothetical protein